MKNITITMDDDTARWARIEAARRGTSVSRMLGELLQRERLHDAEYHAVRKRYLERDVVSLKSAEQRYPDRDSLHERTG